MRKNLVRPILLVGALAVGAAALWFGVPRLRREMRYAHDAKVADRLLQEGSYAEAVPHLQESLDVARGFGSKDPRLDQALQELADAYGAQGNYVESQHLYFASFQNRVEKYGFAHPETADVLFKLGRSYELQNLPDVAEGMYNQAIAAWQQMSRPDDPQATAAYLGLARVLLKLQRPAEAVGNHAKAIEIQERVLGADNPQLAPLVDAYGALLEAAGREADARQARDKARRLRLETAPASGDEPKTAAASTTPEDASPPAAPSPTAVANDPESSKAP